MCATLVRGFSQEMLSSLQEVDLRLKSLRSRMEGVNGVSLQVLMMMSGRIFIFHTKDCLNVTLQDYDDH